MVNLIEEAAEVVDPTQSASGGTEAFLRANPATMGFTAASDAADFVTGNDNSPNPAVGAAVGVTDFVTDPVGALTGGDGDGDGSAGLGGLITPTNIAILIGAYFVVTRTSIGEQVGDAITGG